MKTIVSTNTITNSPNLTSSGFTIRQKNLAKIINIVENDIYSDKILAVIREYSCNAYDANVEAGKRETPIIVTLPSKISLEFKVRDYGLGLTEVEIHEVYTSYGESTKENSDDYIGQLGIGSKSAFAYGDNFVVTSWKHGVKTIYNAVKGANDRQMVKLYSEPSTEPSGIEVSVPIKQGDDAQFKNKSIAFFKYWVVQPQLFGVSEQELESVKDKILLGSTDWYAYKRRDCNEYNNRAIAIMGNISYPIQWNLVSEKLVNKSMDDRTRSIYDFITHNNFVMRFNIGELQMAPSREALQYTDHTINAIIKRIVTICGELETIVINRVNDAKTLWEYKCNFNSIFGRLLGSQSYRTVNDVTNEFSNLEYIDNIYQLVKNRLMFNGVNVLDGCIDDLHGWDAIRGKLTGPTLASEPQYIPLVTLYNLYRGDRLNIDETTRTSSRFTIQASPNAHILIMDLDRKTHIKNCIKWYIESNELSRVYALNFKNSAVRSAFLAAYDFTGATIVNLSDIFAEYKPMIPKRQSSRKSEDDTVYCGTLGPNNFFSYYRRNTISTLFECHANINLKNETGYYIDISRGETLKVNNKIMTPSSFFNHIYKLKDLGIIGMSNIDRVCGFGVRIMEGKKLARNKKNWVNFVTYIEKTLKDIDKEVYVVNSIMRKRIQSVSMESFFIHKKQLMDITSNFSFSADHLLNKLNDVFPTMTEKINDSLGILGELGVDVTEDCKETATRIETYFDTIANKYPMIKTLIYSQGYTKVNNLVSPSVVGEIVNYINLVDKLSNKV